MAARRLGGSQLEPVSVSLGNPVVLPGSSLNSAPALEPSTRGMEVVVAEVAERHRPIVPRLLGQPSTVGMVVGVACRAYLARCAGKLTDLR